MTILQLLTDLRDDISIRAVASYSKVLNGKNIESLVYAPLSRELSYFKRWGAKIVGDSSSFNEIKYTKPVIKEICSLIKSKNVVILHVYDIAGYKAALQIKKLFPIKIVMSLHKSLNKENFISQLEKVFFGEPIPKVCTLVPSKETYKKLLTLYSRKNIELYHVPVPIDFSVYDEKKISHERTISLATQWGMLEKPRHIILAKAYFQSKKWCEQIIKISVELEKLADPIKPYLVILKDLQDGKAIIEFEKKYFRHRNSVLCLMETITDIEAALKLSSIYLELNPNDTYYSLDILNALAMRNSVVSWKSNITQELVPQDQHACLIRTDDLTSIVKKLETLLKLNQYERDFTGRSCRNFVLNNFNIKNTDELLMNAYTTLSLKNAS
ncbi:hypothetical protein OA005_02635 [Paracoccaceae bacterium]|nr:hypothetical protein [Paracoccaceae bacterium]